MTLTKMEKSCKYLINTFRKYSEQEKPHNMLSKDEFTKLVKEEFPNFLLASRTPEGIYRLFKEMDQDKDVQLSFDEFVALVSKVLINTNATLHRDH